jgi:hypothetical protein
MTGWSFTCTSSATRGGTGAGWKAATSIRTSTSTFQRASSASGPVSEQVATGLLDHIRIDTQNAPAAPRAGTAVHERRPAVLAAENSMLASRKTRTARPTQRPRLVGRLRAGSEPRARDERPAAACRQLGLGLVELALALGRVDLDRQRHRRTQQQPFGRDFGDQLVVGAQPERLAEAARAA